jgi:hypothetical protein
MLKNIFIFPILTALILAPCVSGQVPRHKDVLPIELGKLKPSGILDEIRRRKAQNPKLSSADLARIANRLLKTYGSNFTVDPSSYKGASGPRFTLTSVEGKTISFDVDEPFGGPCNEIILNMPVRKISRNEIALVTGGSTFRLKRPKEFITEEFALVDRSLKKVFRRWAAPIDATPFGISTDGRKLYFYFDFADPVYQNSLQFEDLIYEISADGAIQLVPKNHPGIIKGKVLEIQSKDGELAYMSFDTGKSRFFVRYSTICT